ncbi:MAG: tripartite tricarboxylate transporter substrate binding protein [Ideonella sp.]|nr:tripartite tricarboxylate transporter substrate binding protein [Ideonella sp.]MBL0149094.1 tripartite tricarboxylate transporter substrate binding protein [Ideonella sp.]
MNRRLQLVSGLMGIAGMFGLVGLLAAPGAARAQPAFPSKPVTIVVPFPAGGALDIVARALAEEMRKQLGQPVIVDNRAGAGGTVGSALVARAAPDGYTILLGSVATHAIAPGVYRNLTYDALKDFAPITQVTASPLLLASSATLNVKTLPELLATARAQPGKLNYASTGNGTAVHLAGAMLQSAARLDVVHVPYKGGPQAVNALITGEAAFMVVNVELVLPQVVGGKARALAVTGSRRLAVLPDVPTMSEAGLNGVDATTWFGLFAPVGTPKDVVERLQRDAATSLRTLKDNFAKQGDEAIGSTPDEFAAHVRAEHAKWGKLIKDLGVKID